MQSIDSRLAVWEKIVVLIDWKRWEALAAQFNAGGVNIVAMDCALQEPDQELSATKANEGRDLDQQLPALDARLEVSNLH